MSKTKIDGLDETDDAVIVFDNAGFITLVIYGQYQHTYESAKQCAEDVAAYIADKNTAGWDGNELCLCTGDNRDHDDDGICRTCGGWDELEPTDDQVRNGGYRVCYTIAQIAKAASSWGNAQDFCKAANIQYNND